MYYIYYTSRTVGIDVRMYYIQVIAAIALLLLYHVFAILAIFILPLSRQSCVHNGMDYFIGHGIVFVWLSLYSQWMLTSEAHKYFFR